jgi:ornithine cyclodeaminase/alanine dehydrogenase-like protein (mu-crystallin family)
MTLYLTEAEVAELLTPAAAVAAVEASFERLARGVVDNPPRVRAALPGGEFAVMPCVDRELGYAGLKSFAWLPNGTPFLIVLFSIEHARIEAVVEADQLGRLRTAAASAVAAKHLACTGAASLGVFGCGRQAASHVTVLRETLPALERVVVHCRDAGRLASFCADHGAEPGDPAACDVVVTATTAKEPVLRGASLRPGATVIAVGANDLSMRELDDEVLDRASFVCCDSVAQSRLEAGDLAGVLDTREVHELQDVVAGTTRGRASDDDIVVFKSNGLAAWDLAVAASVVATARSSRA